MKIHFFLNKNKAMDPIHLGLENTFFWYRIRSSR